MPIRHYSTILTHILLYIKTSIKAIKNGVCFCLFCVKFFEIDYFLFFGGLFLWSRSLFFNFFNPFARIPHPNNHPRQRRTNRWKHRRKAKKTRRRKTRFCNFSPPTIPVPSARKSRKKSCGFPQLFIILSYFVRIILLLPSSCVSLLPSFTNVFTSLPIVTINASLVSCQVPVCTSS